MALCSAEGCTRHTSRRDDDADKCGPHRAADTRRANRERLEKQLDISFGIQESAEPGASR